MTKDFEHPQCLTVSQLRFGRRQLKLVAVGAGCCCSGSGWDSSQSLFTIPHWWSNTSSIQGQTPLWVTNNPLSQKSQMNRALWSQGASKVTPSCTLSSVLAQKKVLGCMWRLSKDVNLTEFWHPSTSAPRQWKLLVFWWQLSLSDTFVKGQRSGIYAWQ